MLISAHEVTKSFADNIVLEGVSLTIAEGCRYGLRGVNGAGKSTRLSVLFTKLSFPMWPDRKGSANFQKPEGLSVRLPNRSNANNECLKKSIQGQTLKHLHFSVSLRGHHWRIRPLHVLRTNLHVPIKRTEAGLLTPSPFNKQNNFA